MNEPSEIDRVENVSEEQRSAHRALDRNVKVLGLVSLLNANSARRPARNFNRQSKQFGSRSLQKGA